MTRKTASVLLVPALALILVSLPETDGELPAPPAHDPASQADPLSRSPRRHVAKASLESPGERPEAAASSVAATPVAADRPAARALQAPAVAAPPTSLLLGREPDEVLADGTQVFHGVACHVRGEGATVCTIRLRPTAALPVSR